MNAFGSIFALFVFGVISCSQRVMIHSQNTPQTPVESSPTVLKISTPANEARLSTDTFTIEGDCDSSKGKVELSGDFKEANPAVEVLCVADRFKYTPATLTHLDGTANEIVAQQAGLTDKVILYREVVTTPPPPSVELSYCGDGKVNQGWEECDGGSNCSEQCLNTENDVCRNLVLAKIKVEAFTSVGAGSYENILHLGGLNKKYPTDKWFKLSKDDVLPADLAVDSFKQAKGLLVNRKAGKLQVVLNSELSGNDLEHVHGQIYLYNGTASSVVSDPAHPLENWDNASSGHESLDPDDDYLTLYENVSYFSMTSNAGSDGLILNYSISDDCKPGVDFSSSHPTSPADTNCDGHVEDRSVAQAACYNFAKNVCNSPKHFYVDLFQSSVDATQNEHLWVMRGSHRPRDDAFVMLPLAGLYRVYQLAQRGFFSRYGCQGGENYSFSVNASPLRDIFDPRQEDPRTCRYDDPEKDRDIHDLHGTNTPYLDVHLKQGANLVEMLQSTDYSCSNCSSTTNSVQLQALCFEYLD